MNTPPITPSSSANVIAFPASGKRTGFAKASKDWLIRALAEAPSHATRTFCTAIYLHFNSKIYQETGQLVAWPSWETLIANFGLSERSIRDAITWAEQGGFIQVQRGRRDGQRRTVNKYYANPPNPRVENAPQPAREEISQPGRRTVDSVITESRRGESIRGEYTQPGVSDSATRLDSVNGTPEGLRPEEAEEAKPAKTYNATPELMRVVARWRADANNGSGE